MRTSRTILDPGRGYEIRGGRFTGKVLTIGAGDFVDIIWNDAEFTDCEFRMKRSTGQDFNFGATCTDCDFVVGKPLKNRQMDLPTLVNCRFHGQYAGIDFGPKFPESTGSLRSCDFSSARLHLCAFYGCDLEDLELPDWPHIHLLYGEDLSWTKRLSDESLPRNLLSLIRRPRHESVTRRSILSVHLPSDDCDVEMVWALVQDIPQVWFPSKGQKARATLEQVEQALTANRKALAQLTRTRERTVLLGNLHRAWLKSARRVSDNDVELVFDCSFLRQRVPGAPERIHMRLHRGSARHRLDSSILEINGELDRFMLMGVGEEGNDVVLKPHRKERGQVVLSFESYTLLDDQHQAVAQEAFLKVVSQYYGLDAYGLGAS